jgi:predicted hydrocarbon binding protein
MTERGVGRLLVASLHQGIAELMPARLEFYEGWLSPSGLRAGRIGVAPMAAVLSFLRQEGEPYRLVAARAGEYAAEWSVAELSPLRRRLLVALPPSIRMRLVLSLARRIVRNTYKGSRVLVRWRNGRGAVDIRGSVFCAVRERVDYPLCDFYAAVIRKLLVLFGLDGAVDTERCRATGAPRCELSVLVALGGAARLDQLNGGSVTDTRR